MEKVILNVSFRCYNRYTPRMIIKMKRELKQLYIYMFSDIITIKTVVEYVVLREKRKKPSYTNTKWQHLLIELEYMDLRIINCSDRIHVWPLFSNLLHTQADYVIRI